MNNEKYFTAEEARKVSDIILSDAIKKELDYIYKKIDIARHNGKRSISLFNESFCERTKEFLKEKGFNVNQYYGDQRDPYLEIIISW